MGGFRPMSQLLPTIASPADLHRLNDEQLVQLAQEMRDELVRVLSIRPAHFASNLGVVELCLALHLTFDFSQDRLIWDTGHLTKSFLGILNDNKMPICPRVGALATALDRARLTGFYQGSKRNLRKILSKLPLVGGMATAALDQIRDALKALLTGGMLFEELGFRYIGPVDGHDLPGLRRWLEKVKRQQGPILLHVLTEKGHGVPQASEDPVTYHTPPVFEKVGPQRTIVSFKRGGSKAYTDAVSAAIYQIMGEDTRVTVLTAAMCQGNTLEKVRTDFPDRFFDTAICE